MQKITSKKKKEKDKTRNCSKTRFTVNELGNKMHRNRAKREADSAPLQTEPSFTLCFSFPAMRRNLHADLTSSRQPRS